MKYLLPILLSLSVLCTSLTAVEYGMLNLRGGENSVELLEGDMLEVLNYENKGRWFADGLELYKFINPDSTLSTVEVSHSNYSAKHIIIGPTIVSLINSGSKRANWLTYKITRASEEVLTSNTVTLPAVNGLDWAVTLEQSTDLANWTAVAPGTVTGTDSLQFYRVRVTSNASSGE